MLIAKLYVKCMHLYVEGDIAGLAKELTLATRVYIISTAELDKAAETPL